MKDPKLDSFRKKFDEYVETQLKNYFMNGFVQGVKKAQSEKDKLPNHPLDTDFLKKEFDIGKDHIVNFIPNEKIDNDG